MHVTSVPGWYRHSIMYIMINRKISQYKFQIISFSPGQSFLRDWCKTGFTIRIYSLCKDATHNITSNAMKSVVAALGVCPASLRRRDSLRERKRSADKWESTQTSFPRNVRIFNVVCLAVSEQPDLKSAARKSQDNVTLTGDRVTWCFLYIMFTEKEEEKKN